MKFKPTKIVKIGGCRYKILFDKKRYAREGSSGSIHYYTKEISIDPEGDVVGTLLHEIVHAACEHVQPPSGDVGEEWVCRIAETVRMLVADNPVLFRRLADLLGGGR